MTRDALFASLYGLQEPDAVGLWPLAPGWWWVGGSLLLVLLLGALLLALWHRGRLRRHALRQLRALWEHPPTSDADRARELARLNDLLRDYALTLAPVERVAGRSGLAWLHVLDNTLEPGAFTRGPGRCLLDGPFRPAVAADEVDRDALFRLVQRWLRHARREGV